MTQKIKISLLAKHQIARDVLRDVFSGENFHILQAASSETALVGARGSIDDDVKDHVVIIDGGNGGFGLNACAGVTARKKVARIALLLDKYIFDDVFEAFQIGVDAILIRGPSSAPLIEAIKLVALGEKMFPAQLVSDLTRSDSGTHGVRATGNVASIGLSGREAEILESIMAGMANKAIARQLGICEATVKVHVKAILRKLGVENRTQAATWGVMNGLAEPGRFRVREIGPVRSGQLRSALSGEAA